MSNVLSRNTSRRPWTRLALGACLLLAVGAVIWLVRARSTAPNLQLVTPALALEKLSAKSLYYNAAARPWLLAQRPDVLAPEDRDDRSERVRTFVQAAQDPKLFRQLDRRHRFDTLFLVGDPSQHRPLLEHLLEAKDWTLTYLDHTSLIYQREAARAWHVGELAAVRQRFTGREEAAFLAQAAAKLLALRMHHPAKTLLDDAKRLDGRSAEVWSALATFHMLQGEWVPALAAADRALDLDPKSLNALAAKSQILFSTKRFPEALALSTKLIAARPGDPALLFYHAKIAHQTRAFAEEIATLEKLIALAEHAGQSASGYRLYLAQAYAADGQAEPSIEQFTSVLADRDLPKEQRAFAEETLAQIKSRISR